MQTAKGNSHMLLKPGSKRRRTQAEVKLAKEHEGMKDELVRENEDRLKEQDEIIKQSQEQIEELKQ